LHSGKLLQALLQTIQSMGVYVFNNTEVKECLKVNEGIVVHTGEGFDLSTKQVLICTNAFARELMPQLDIIPARGQVLLTSPIDALPWKGSFHSDGGYYYFRNLGERVLLGGARHKAFAEERSTDFGLTDTVQGHLEKYLREVILPGYKKSFTIDHRWSGIMAMGSDKLPIVEEISPDIFCAVRMSGIGVSLAPVIGKKIAKMMLH
ncbi:MAG TPA: FAD-dependent oxidoreductase, partial [Chitinophagaceae bacterium]|nr:FAD-dependent oxidoreductase [Chitinophagaceae bacterium]